MDIRTELKNIIARYVVDADNNCIRQSRVTNNEKNDWLTEMAKFFKQHNIFWRFYPVPACSYITYVISWEEQGWMQTYSVCELRESWLEELRESGWKSED